LSAVSSRFRGGHSRSFDLDHYLGSLLSRARPARERYIKGSSDPGKPGCLQTESCVAVTNGPLESSLTNMRAWPLVGPFPTSCAGAMRLGRNMPLHVWNQGS